MLILRRYTFQALPSFLPLLLFPATPTGVTALPSPSWQEPRTVKALNRYFQPGTGHSYHLAKRYQSNVTDVPTGLPPHHWQLTKTASEIEQFRQQHNLTFVESHAHEAAVMPSWPQAFVQYIVVAPPIVCSYSSTTTVNGVVTSQSRDTSFWVLAIASPFLFVAWTVSWGLTQASKTNAGWISVLGWSSWLSLSFEGWWPFTILPLLFQFAASFGMIIQRWRGSVGAVAYEIVDLHGCTPSEGLSYLEQGARSRQYRIFQTVSFSYTFLCGISHYKDRDRKSFAGELVIIALAELIMDAVVARSGTPIVVSGNCLLVELSPRLGFLDSGVSTGWKALSSFMGF